MNRSLRRNLTVCLPLAVAAFSASLPARARADNAQFKEQIRNGQCCVPNLSHGYHPLRLRDGHGVQGDETVVLGRMILGQLEGQPVAVVAMSQNGGGTGWFNSLLLYEQQQGKAVVVGSYPFGDRTIVRELRLAQGKVRLVSEGSLGPDEGKPITVTLRRQDFERTECLEAPLAPELKRDVRALMKLWEAAYGDKLSSAKKQEALEICNRHRQDRAFFARAFMLTLGEAGWLDPDDAAPLQFDATGNPAFYTDDGKEQKLLDLTQ